MRLQHIKKCLCTLCAAALGLCLLPMACAAEEQPRVVRVGYLHSGTYIQKDIGDTVSGYGVDYFSQVGQYTGWSFEYVGGSITELMQKLQNREIDLIGGIQRDAPQAEQLEYCRYASGNKVFYLYGRQDAQELYYNDYQAFNGLTVAVVEGASQEAVLDRMEAEHGFSMQRVTAWGETDAARMVESGQADVMVVNTTGWQDRFKLLSHITAEPIFSVSWKGNTALIAELEDALGHIAAEKPTFIQDLQFRYFGAQAAARQPSFTRQESEYIRRAGPISTLLYTRIPWSWVDPESGEVRGITVDILNELGRVSGLQFEYTALPHATSPVEAVKKGEYQLCAGVMDCPMFRADEGIALSDPYYTDTLLALCRKGFAGSLTDELRAELPAGFAAARSYLGQQYPNYHLGDSLTIQECFDQVLGGKADIAIADSLVIGQFSQNPRYESLTSLPRFSLPENMCAAAGSGPEGELLISILNESIQCLDDQVLSRIVLNNTVAAPSQLAWQDLLYKYRSTLVVGGGLLVILLGVLAAALAQRHRHVNQLFAANRQLEQAVRETRQANQAKGDFLSRMSHEIRTPLNAILGFSSLAGDHLDDPARARDYLQKTQTAGHLLLGIINDVLDMAAIEQGKLKLAAEPFELGGMLDAVDSMYSAQCREKGLAYLPRRSGDLACAVVGDELRTQQILMNLLSNAVKFTPAGGQVALEVKELEAPGPGVRLRFAVSDTGEGMSPEMLERLFQPFEQEDGTTARRHGGSGLGLSIVKALVEAMQGTLKVQSEKGKGTRFTVELPFGLPAPGQAAAGSAGPAEAPRLPGVHILLAEDNEMNALLAQELLGPTGAQVDWAQDGSKALQMFLASPEGYYQLILMDIQMPGMNGYETARRLRAAPRADAPGVPVLAMTADAFKQDVEKAAAAGMDGHIAKPIDPGLLYRALADYLP